MPKEKDGDDTEGASAEWEVVNQASALWTRPKAELKDEEYQAFYKHVAHDYNDALAWSHNRVEGNQNFTSLLYIPSKSPFDLMMGRARRTQGIEALRQARLHHGRGRAVAAGLACASCAVSSDSDDLPLNVEPRDPAAESQISRNSRRPARGACSDLLDKLAKDEPEKIRDFLAGIPAPCSRKAPPRISPTRSASRSCCVFASTQSDRCGADPSRSTITSAA